MSPAYSIQRLCWIMDGWMVIIDHQSLMAKTVKNLHQTVVNTFPMTNISNTNDLKKFCFGHINQVYLTAAVSQLVIRKADDRTRV